MAEDTLIDKLLALKYAADSGIDPLCVATNNDAADKCVAIASQHEATGAMATECLDGIPITVTQLPLVVSDDAASAYAQGRFLTPEQVSFDRGEDQVTSNRLINQSETTS